MNCPICNSNLVTKKFSKKNKGFYYCNNCKITFQYPIIKKEINQYYKNQYYSKNERTSAQFINWLTKEKYRQYIKKLKKYQSDGDLLDIGAGYGYFVKICNENGYNAFGVEPNKNSVAYAKNELNTKLDCKFFDKNYRKKIKFDIITNFHVIEHVLNPIDFIENINKKLKKGGILFLETPNINSFNSNLLKENWPFILPNEHLFYFSFESLIPILENNGFKVLETIRSGPFIYKKGNKLTKSIRSQKPTIKLKILNKIYGFLSTILFGDHLIIIAKKVK